MRNLTISLDMMGGDIGLSSTLPAAIEAVTLFPNLTLLLCGDKPKIHQHLSQLNTLSHPRLIIIHCTQQVRMDDKPAVALRGKPDSSMRVALNLVNKGEAMACVSAGNTGALLATAHYVLKMLPGVERPALITTLPTQLNKPVYLLDLGANVTCDSEVLFQFAVMGSVLAQQVEGISQPQVALLNMGEEDIKGSDQIKHAAALLKKTSNISYVGFIEGSDIFKGKADVIVCDGLVGNVALKTCEGIIELLINRVKQQVNAHWGYRLLGWLLLPAFKRFYQQMNPDQYNGASLIGLNGIVVKSHGNAQSKAFLSAIKEAVKEVQRQVPEKIKDKVEQALIDKL